GLMTRYAALPLLLVALGLQYAYEPFDSQLFWIALFGWLVIHGAGPISLDHLLRRGLSDSALPLMSPLMHLSGWLRSRGTPLYLTALRIWLACALLVAATLRIGHNTLFIHDTLSSALALWLPLDVAVRLPPYIALSGGVLLLLGAGTRFAAVAAVLALCADSMVDPRSTDAVYLLMVLAILTVHGGGALSFDRLVDWLAGKVFPVPGSRDPRVLAGRPRVVIVGAGFGGISCARALRHTRAAVTLIDRTNYHLFQPLLYQVATAALSPGDIATPARQLFRDAFGTRVLLGTVTGIDPRQHQVVLADQEIAYDYLVLATGATHSYFGKDEWAPHAPGLKSIEDATEIRRRILLAFEEAEATPDEGRRAALLTFLIVGGGPTGVELAGAIAELSRFGMTQDFRAFDPGQARVVLVQSGPRLLPSFPEKLALNAHRALEKLGVELHLNSRVDHIDGAGVAVNGRRIEARTVLWAAGVAASPAARWLNLEPDRAGRIPVGPDLRVPGLANVFAVGDTALSHAWKGAAVPGLAPAAKQGGKYVARQIHAAIHAGPAPAAFRYRHFGSLAAIGRKSAVVDFGRVRVWGAPAWWLWGIVHVGFLLGMRNRVATMVNWFWAYLRFGGGIRLITGVR
ncbi:MAG TPA: NAD(P)/FAD-dependent oxidoreductase, partial [Steroidobacteraceae bacterium]|nr:NAD(P)/FAD-dependent oxidoreductase [Steroidobacteraceae bacterium]